MEYINHFFNLRKGKKEVKKEGRNYNENREIVITELDKGSPTFTVYVNEKQYQQYIRNMMLLASREPIVNENSNRYLVLSGHYKFYVMTTTDTLLRCLNPEMSIEEVLLKEEKDVIPLLSDITSDDFKVEYNYPMGISQFFSEQ